MNKCLFNKEENFFKKKSSFLQNENQETRLCGNERLKAEFFEVSSCEGTFELVVVDEDDDDDGIILFDGDIDWINDDGGETDNGIGVIGDGRDGIENGVIGDDNENIPCWEGENNWYVNGSIIISSFWREEYWGDNSSIAPINEDWNNIGS